MLHGEGFHACPNSLRGAGLPWRGCGLEQEVGPSLGLRDVIGDRCWAHAGTHIWRGTGIPGNGDNRIRASEPSLRTSIQAGGCTLRQAGVHWEGLLRTWVHILPSTGIRDHHGTMGWASVGGHSLGRHLPALQASLEERQQVGVYQYKASDMSFSWLVNSSPSWLPFVPQFGHEIRNREKILLVFFNFSL